MAQVKNKQTSFTIALVVTVIVALAAMFGVIAYYQFTTTYAYVVNKNIDAGTQITAEMLDSQVIQRVSIPKTLDSNNLIKDFNQINKKFILYDLKPGKMVFTYDVATEYNIRTLPIIAENNFEAFTVKKSSFAAGTPTNVINTGDRINIYTVSTYDLSEIKAIKQQAFVSGNAAGSLTATVNTDNGGLAVVGGTTTTVSPTETMMEQLGIKVSELPENIREVCLDSGLDEDFVIYQDSITVAKLTWQNVPVASVLKTTGENASSTSISEIVFAVDSQTAEEMYVALQTCQLGFTMLPYIDGDYTVIDNTGTTDIDLYTNFGRNFE